MDKANPLPEGMDEVQMKDRSKQFSRQTWADPTRSLNRLKNVERKLTALFINYRKRVIAELSPVTQPSFHTQKSPILVLPDIKRFFTRLEELSMQELIAPANNILEKEISDAFIHGVKYADINIKATMGIKLGAPLEERQRAWKKIGVLVEKAKGEFKGVSDATNQQIRRVISDGMVNEQSLKTVSRSIQDATEGIGENRARLIAKNETMLAIREATKDRYDEAGAERYERLEAEDERTCEYCSSIDGKICTRAEADEIDANMHPGCRGNWIISEESLGIAEPDEYEESTQKRPIPGCTCGCNEQHKQGGECGAGEPGSPGFQPGNSCAKGDGDGTISAKVSEHISDFNKAYPKEKIEHFRAYKDGKIIAETHGNGHETEFPTKIDLKGTDLIHNHPRNTPALSPPDVWNTIASDANSMTAITKDGRRWTMTRPKNGWPQKSKFMVNWEWKDAQREVNGSDLFKAMVEKVKAKQMTVAAGDREYTEMISRNALNRMGISLEETHG
jgi:SPP1 gp7 family putative phage head morphogenesis protein